MATASTIHLTPRTTGSYYVPSITPDALSKTSALLQKNHEQNHMYFNDDGFHNHIVHHLLTLLSLGATPAQIQAGYDQNSGYQKPLKPAQHDATSMADPDTFNAHLGQQSSFPSYLAYFTAELAANGVEDTLTTHLFASTPHATDLLKRMYSGFYHPLIHLGFGVEYAQPAIIAEALAQAATHDIWIDKILSPVSAAAASARDKGPATKTLVQLLHEARDSATLRTAAEWRDGNKVRDGVIARAGDEMVRLASQWYLPATPTQDDLDRATAEMYNASVYFTGLAQRANKARKCDFYFIHCTNSAVFFPVFMGEKLGFVDANKKREMLEYKAWIDLAMYVSRRCPELLPDAVKGYVGKNGGNQAWEGLFERIDGFDDDGHASKLVRSLARGQQVCEGYEAEGQERFPVHGDMWLRLANLVVDSVEEPGDTWVRSAGFDEAWEKVPALEEGASKL